MNNNRCLTIGRVSTEAIRIRRKGAEHGNMAWPRGSTLPLTQSKGVGNGDVTQDETLTRSTNCKRSQPKKNEGVLQGESYQSPCRSMSHVWNRHRVGHNTTRGHTCSSPRHKAVSPCAEAVTDVAEKIGYQARPHSIWHTYPKRGVLAQHCPQRHTKYGLDPNGDTWLALQGQQSRPPCAMCAQCPACIRKSGKYFFLLFCKKVKKVKKSTKKYFPLFLIWPA